VILQTYDPNHYAIQAAANHDFHSFYKQEILSRKQIGYPPFSRLVRLLIRAESAERARREATRLYQVLNGRISEQRLVSTSLIGPAPAFYTRLDQIYRWHVIIRGPNPTAILDGLQPSARLHVDIDPVSLL
jgi:primosomal protein N' (replication factor Y)